MNKKPGELEAEELAPASCSRHFAGLRAKV